MPDPSSNSFIPKRGPASRPGRATTTRRVYVFTLISYILLFATLLASGGMFLYGKYLDKQLAEEVKKLDSEIKSFSVAKMEEVLEFEKRLREATSKIDSTASIASIFEALESTTIDTVTINSLELLRNENETYTLTATVETDSFDSTISQRGVYQRDQVLDTATIMGVQANAETTEGGGTASGIEQVTFTAVLDIPIAAVPYRPSTVSTGQSVITTEATIQAVPEVEAPVEGVAEQELNEEQI